MGKEAETDGYSYNATFEMSSRPKTEKAAHLSDKRTLEETNKLLEELIVQKEESARLKSPLD